MGYRLSSARWVWPREPPTATVSTGLRPGTMLTESSAATTDRTGNGSSTESVVSVRPGSATATRTCAPWRCTSTDAGPDAVIPAAVPARQKFAAVSPARRASTACAVVSLATIRTGRDRDQTAVAAADAPGSST